MVPAPPSGEGGYPELLAMIAYADGRYVSRARVWVACMAGFFALLFLIALASSQPAFGRAFLAALVVASIGLALRATVSFVVELEPDQLTVKGLYRTRRFYYGDLEAADAVEGLVMLKPRVYASYRLKSGRIYRSRDINESTRNRATVDSMVSDINARIAAAKRGDVVV